MEDKQPLNELDFSEEIAADPELQQYIEKELQLLKENNEPLVDLPPIFEMKWSNRVIVDGLPEVNDEKKAQSLIKFLSRLCIKSKCPIEPSEINMPMKNDTSLQFAILTFTDEETAKSAVTNLNGVFLDKKHQLSVVSFDEFDRLMEIEDVYKEPRIYSQQELKNWLTDNLGRDQFIIRFGDKTQVFWNDVLAKAPQLVTSGPTDKIWTDKYVYWSCDGTYLATLHTRGVVIWAGPEFEEIGKLEHYGVTQINFSPCERYVLTFSPRQKFIVWNLSTREEIRTFSAEEEKWGTYRWSYNGDYIAKMSEETIFIYETSSMALLEDENGQKRPLKIESLGDFSWCPTSNIIACYIKENSKKPALIKLISIPSKESLASRTFFHARACTFYWQSEGEFLVSSVRTSSQDSNTSVKTIFEVMCLKVKNIPTYSFTINFSVVSCALQSGTNRFAIIYGKEKDIHKKFVVYEVNSKNEVDLIGEKDTIMNEILWAPQGDHILVFSKEKYKFLFYSVTEKGIADIEERTYSNMNYLEWDPSGRYLIVAKTNELKSNQIQTQGTGYSIYNGQGELIYQFPIDKFYQVSWRPRPRFILPKQVHEKLMKEYEHLAIKYAKQDKEIKRKAKQEAQRRENEKKAEFLAVISKNREIWQKTANERKNLLGRSDEEENQRWISKLDLVEEIMSVVKTKIPDSVAT
jgi:translation initiation factor 3 subunit B